MASSNEAPIIIIKKKKKGGRHAHHGGAWKVAYADFVTAMMAFFLLLWLLNTTTDEQRGGIADYFNPAAIAYQASGAGGVLGVLSSQLPRRGMELDSRAPRQQLANRARCGTQWERRQLH